MEAIPPPHPEVISSHRITTKERTIRLDLSNKGRRDIHPIAEGCGRDGEAELARFLTIAKGSTSEVEYLLQLANHLNYIQPEQHQNLSTKTIEIRKMLHGLLKTLRR